MENTNKLTSRTILGGVLIVIGALFLLQNFHIIPFNVENVIFSFPSLLVLIGTVSLINSRNKLFGAIILVCGVLLMIPRLFPFLGDIDEDIIVPVIIVIFGLYLVLRNNQRGQAQGDKFGKPNGWRLRNDGEINKDKIDDVNIFGGGTKFIRSENFQGGSVTAVFGGTELDLTDCKLAPGDSVLDIVAVFGGMEILVPENWNVRVDVFPLFGGFTHKVRRIPADMDTTRTLFIKGIVIFGGGEIKAR